MHNQGIITHFQSFASIVHRNHKFEHTEERKFFHLQFFLFSVLLSKIRQIAHEKRLPLLSMHKIVNSMHVKSTKIKHDPFRYKTTCLVSYCNLTFSSKRSAQFHSCLIIYECPTWTWFLAEALKVLEIT